MYLMIHIPHTHTHTHYTGIRSFSVACTELFDGAFLSVRRERVGREEGKKSMPRKREGEREEKIKNYNIIA